MNAALAAGRYRSALPRTKAELAGASWWVAGDGRALPFRDAAFDVV